VLVLLLLFVAGCGFLPRPTTVPMATRQERSVCPQPASTLLVFLPGAGSLPDEFVREGFLREVQSRRIAADMLIADAHRGYYSQRSVLVRLDADVIAPARQQGYRAIWLVGISLGGLGAMLYEEALPGRVTGLVALAPYLGDERFIETVSAAGGIAGWRAPPEAPTDGVFETRLWRWLQGYAAPAAAARPPIYLGYGASDRFAASNALLGAVLPPAQVFTTRGGHDWNAWRPLWRDVLQVLPLPHCR
jgi:pimeloyl-ACP methyl ester carboxylesterase